MENTSMESLLKSLREDYQKGNFDAVTDALLKNKSSFSEGEFHYNLGTVYAKAGNFAVGRYHLEKAILKGYDSVAAKHNLLNVKDTIAVHDISNSKSVDDVMLSTSMGFGQEYYLFFTLLLMATTLFLFIKKSFGKIGLVLMLLISLSPLGFKYLWLDKLSVALVFESAEVYEGPSGIFEKTGSVPKGAKVIFGKATEGWVFIERPVEYVGWIKSKDIGVLK